MEESKEELEARNGLTTKNESGNTLINEYRLIRNIGKGAYGKVKLCEADGQFFASKIFRKSQLSNRKNFIEMPDGELKITSGFTDVQREIAIMKKLTHQNVVRLKDVIFDDDTDKLYIIMEYCKKGPAMEWDEDTERFDFRWCEGEVDEETLRRIMRGTVCGLEYLHYHGIAHRDIKPENILISEDWTVKLADFGQSHLVGDKEMDVQLLGTFFFFPPECCGENQNCEVAPMDVWALGVTFYAFVFKKLPFSAESEAELFEKIQNWPVEFPDGQEIDTELKKLIERMLDKNPGTRIKIFEIIQNPWLNKNSLEIQMTVGEKIVPSDAELNSAILSLKSAVSAVTFI